MILLVCIFLVCVVLLLYCFESAGLTITTYFPQLSNQQQGDLQLIGHCLGFWGRLGNHGLNRQAPAISIKSVLVFKRLRTISRTVVGHLDLYALFAK